MKLPPLYGIFPTFFEEWSTTIFAPAVFETLAFVFDVDVEFDTKTAIPIIPTDRNAISARNFLSILIFLFKNLHYLFYCFFLIAAFHRIRNACPKMVFQNYCIGLFQSSLNCLRLM